MGFFNIESSKLTSVIESRTKGFEMHFKLTCFAVSKIMPQRSFHTWKG